MYVSLTRVKYIGNNDRNVMGHKNSDGKIIRLWMLIIYVCYGDNEKGLSIKELASQILALV